MNIVEKINDDITVKNVLISLSDKSHLEQLVTGLIKVNPRIRLYSTGGTYKAIEKILGSQAEKNLIAVSDYTGQPEMQGGLVKTLDFKIYLGLLSETYNQAHQEDLQRQGAVAFDMVVVNLYPFVKTVTKEGVTLEEARSNIDIGGPTMLRASAKNYIRVASVCNPQRYGDILAELEETKGTLSFKTRYELARETFAHTSQYDTAIIQYLQTQNPEEGIKNYKIVKE